MLLILKDGIKPIISMYGSFGILLSLSLCLLSPSSIFMIVCSISIHGSVQVRNQHQRFKLLHDGSQFFCGSPLGSCFDHVLTDFSFFVDIGVVDLGFEGDDRSFEGEVVELELDGEVSSFEGRGFWSCDVNVPKVVLLLNDNIVPT